MLVQPVAVEVHRNFRRDLPHHHPAGHVAAPCCALQLLPSAGERHHDASARIHPASLSWCPYPRPLAYGELLRDADARADGRLKYAVD
ncbi:MAG: hypothetical protein MJZ15_07515 [Bacteroidales bacterium]|nr:hypothetical protein [Bacteroidales bacterium]